MNLKHKHMTSLLRSWTTSSDQTRRSWRNECVCVCVLSLKITEELDFAEDAGKANNVQFSWSFTADEEPSKHTNIRRTKRTETSTVGELKSSPAQKHKPWWVKVFTFSSSSDGPSARHILKRPVRVQRSDGVFRSERECVSVWERELQRPAPHRRIKSIYCLWLNGG